MKQDKEIVQSTRESAYDIRGKVHKRFFGYMYCSWSFGGLQRSWTPSIYDVRVVDEHTVHVFQGV